MITKLIDIRTAARFAGLVSLLGVSAALAPTSVSAQFAAQTQQADGAAAVQTFHACYVPKSGTVYRIKATAVPASCTKVDHIEFSWTEGGEGGAGIPGPQGEKGDPGPQGPAGSLETADAGGDLSGSYPNPTVSRLQGRAVANAVPADGQVLGWNQALSRWEPKQALAGNAFTLPYAGVANAATTLFQVKQEGSGLAARFQSVGNTAVEATTSSGAGIHGRSVSGTGVKAESVLNMGNALEITRGTIRVAGAGLNTPTAAFRITIPPSDTHAHDLDHPMLNGDPNAIVFLQRVILPNELATGVDDGSRLLYGNGKWRVIFNSSLKPYYHSYNVIVIKS